MKNISDEYSKWVIFSLDNQDYCIEVIEVKEIIYYRKITHVFGAKNNILGLVNLRGNLITVIDIRRSLTTKKEIKDKEITKNSKIIIINALNLTFAILVDKVKNVLEIKKDDIKPAPKLSDSFGKNIIQGVYQTKESFFILLDLKHIFSNKI